jgi:hypothetical protein
MSALARLSSLLGLFGGNQNSYGIPLSNRNYFVDGNIDSIIASSVVVAATGSSNNAATMYYGIAGATNGGTLSAAWTLGYDPVGMTSPVANSLVWTQTTAPTTAPSITQRVENVQTLQGRSATFSCWLWCASGTQTITNIQTLQHFGNGGSPSVDVSVNVPVNWVLTTTPQRFSVRLNIPSVVGKTLGTTANTHYLQVYLQYPIAANYAISTTQWQLEQSSPNSSSDINGNGGDPTAFEYRGQQAELARVQRYYNVTAPYGVFVASAAAQNWGTYSPYPVPMRAQPALTMLSNNSTGQSPPGTYGFTQSTIYGYALVITSGGTGWLNVAGTVAADARL